MTVAHLITIGGSDAAGVLGVSPYTDPVTVAARISVVGYTASA